MPLLNRVVCLGGYIVIGGYIFYSIILLYIKRLYC